MNLPNLPPAEAAVITYDPQDDHPEGEVVRHAEIDRVRAENIVALDTSHADYATPGAGYARRSFGYGQELDTFGGGPSFLCPVLLRVGPGKNVLHWAALLRRVRNAVPNGQLRLGVMPLDSGRPPSLANLDHVQLDQLDPDSDVWIVQGHALIDSDLSMALPIALSGVGTGVRARWLAIGHRILG